MTRRALITGGSAGLGLEFARQLSDDGFELVLVARDAERLKQVADRIPTACEVLAADLTDESAIERVAARLADPKRPIDVLVSNAGAGIADEFARSSIDDERWLFELLAWAPLRLAHAALPGMIERGRGGILNVASLAGLLPSGTYGAAKAHVISLTSTIAARHRSDGIRATALLPGLLRTEFHDRMGASIEGIPSLLWANPGSVVRDGLRGLRRGRRIVVSDWRYRLAAPLVPVVPDRVLVRMSAARQVGGEPNDDSPV